MENNLGNKKTMASNIRYYMALNDVTSKELCETLGFSPSTFSYWITAKTYPRIDKIEKMARYFHITKSDLVEERDVPKKEPPIQTDDGQDTEKLRLWEDIGHLNPQNLVKAKEYLSLLLLQQTTQDDQQ